MTYQAQTQQQSRRRPLVYYVEDDDEMAEMYGLMLNQKYDVRRLRSGAEVLRQLENDDDAGALPNLVVLDHHLPDISGTEVLQAIRQYDGYDGILVVMLSNHNDPSVTEAAFRMGALAWLVKAAMTPQQVANRLQLVLDRRGKTAG